MVVVVVWLEVEEKGGEIKSIIYLAFCTAANWKMWVVLFT